MSKLEVTNVEFNERPNKTLVGYATITLNDALQSTGWKVFKNDNGYSVRVPATKAGNGNYIDTIRFARTEARKAIEAAVIDAVNAYYTSSQSNQSADKGDTAPQATAERKPQ